MSIGEDQLARILARDQSRLTAWIWAIVRDHDTADDVYQDLCVSAVQNRHKISDEAHLHNWLHATARHRSIDALRASQSDALVFDDDVYSRLEHRWAAANRRQESVQIEALRSCMGELNDNNRRLLELRYARNLKGKELAQSLGRQPNTVFVALSRVHKALAECVEKRLAEEADHG